MAPSRQPLHLVALGPSVPTGPDGITADVVSVAAFEELKALGDGARGQDRAVQPARHAARADLRGVRPRGGRARRRRRGGGEGGRGGGAGALGGHRRLSAAAHRRACATTTRRRRSRRRRVAAEDADLHRIACCSRPVARSRAHEARARRRASTARSSRPTSSARCRGASARDEVVLLGAHLDSWDLGHRRHRRRGRLRGGDGRGARDRVGRAGRRAAPCAWCSS